MNVPIKLAQQIHSKATLPSAKRAKDVLITAETQTHPDDGANRPLRMAMWIMFIVLGIGGTAAAFVPLSSGVVANGVIAADGGNKILRHPTGGIVRTINVVEGKHVKTGETLFQLDDTTAKSDFASLEAQYFSLRAKEERLKAERLGLTEIDWPKDLLAHVDGRKYVNNELSVMSARRNTLAQALHSLRKSASGYEKQAQTLAGRQSARGEQLAAINKELNAKKGLLSAGVVSPIQIANIEERAASVRADQSGEIANAQSLRQQATEALGRAAAMEHEFLRDTEKELTDAQRDLVMLGEKLKSAREIYESMNMRAPVAGSVVGMKAKTIGSSVSPGETLAEIVPDDANMIVDAKIPVNSGNRIETGMEVDIRFPVAGATMLPIIPGKLRWLSEDQIKEENSNVVYYAAKVEIPHESVTKLMDAGLRIKPGLPAEALIKTGSQTILDYWLAPLQSQLFRAWREK